jgi:hypothetical protein
MGGKMKLKVLLGLAIICLMVCSNSSVAVDFKCYSAPDTCQVCWDTTQTPATVKVLDLHACDTVRIGCPVCVNDLAVGDSFQVPIYLYNDAKIDAFSFPFRHYGRHLRFGWGGDNGLDCTDGTILTVSQQGGIQFTLDEGEPDTDTASALLGWVDWSASGKPILANTTGAAKLLGYLYLVLTPGVTNQVVRFDTAFFPPAGEWLACNDRSVLSGVMERPKFVTCRELASPPCDINLGDTPEYYSCGDVDGSGNINIADLVYIIDYIFRQGAPPQDALGGDVDCDLKVTIADVVYLINYVFRAGPKPCLGCE